MRRRCLLYDYQPLNEDKLDLMASTFILNVISLLTFPENFWYALANSKCPFSRVTPWPVLKPDDCPMDSNCESLRKKMIGKPYSGMKLYLR